MTIKERCEALDAVESLTKLGFVELGGKRLVEQKDIAAYFGVGKALISKLKTMSSSDKEKLRASGKAEPRSSKRTRNQVH